MPKFKALRRPPLAKGIAFQLLHKWRRGWHTVVLGLTRKQREALEGNGYKCKACPTLLASGARCPHHPRLKPASNGLWREWMTTGGASRFSEIAQKEVA